MSGIISDLMEEIRYLRAIERESDEKVAALINERDAALILLDESRQHNAAMLDRLYESLGVDSSDGEIRFKWAMLAVENVKRERDAALAHVQRLLAGKWNGDEYKALLDTATMLDIQAEAGRAGFFEAAQIYSDLVDERDYTPAADKYVERVKAGVL